MSLNDVQARMVEQLRRRGYYPTDETECFNRLVEEMGEVARALRSETPEKQAEELLDVIWQAMRLAECKGIDLDAAFDAKLAYNETRP